MNKPGRADWIYVAALCLLVALVYLPQLFSGRSAMEAPAMVDVSSQWLPGYSVQGRMWRAGEFPLWNWQQYAGMPWLAYSHAGVLYPPNIFLLSLLDFVDAATLLLLLHALAAALGTYALLRSLRVSSLSSFLAALTFALSGFFFFFQSQLSSHGTAAWVPLLLFAVRRLLLTRRAGPFILTAALTAAMLLAGDAEGFIYNLIFVFFFILFQVRREEPGALMRMLFLAGCAMGVGMALSSPLALALAEHASRSVRSQASPFQLDFGDMLEMTHFPYHLFFPFRDFQRFMPGSAYNAGLPPFYLGLAPLLIMVYAISSYRRDATVSAFVNLMAAMIVFVAVRKAQFLAPVISRVPVLGQLSTVERTLGLIQLAWLLAAAAAFDRFRSGEGRRRLMFMGAILLLWGCANANLNHVLAGGEQRWVAAIAMLALGAAALWTGRKRAAGARALAAAAVVLVMTDAYLLALGCVPRTGQDQFRLDPAVQAFADKQDPEYRFISFERFAGKQVRPEVAGMVASHTALGSAFGYMRLPDWRYFEFLHLIDPDIVRDWISVLTNSPATRKEFYAADLYNPAYLDDKNLPLLNLAAARYVFSRGIPFKFSSPYSLLNEPGLVKENYGRLGKGNPPWALYKVPRITGPVSFNFRPNGAVVSTEFPQTFSFTSYVYPDTSLLFELAPFVECSGPWRGRVRVSGTAEGQDSSTVLYASSVETEGDWLKYSLALDKLAGRTAQFKIELTSDEDGSWTYMIDPRLIRPDAPFQRLETGPIEIYINTRALPRSFIVHDAMSLSGPDLRAIMMDPARFDPGRTILFEAGGAADNLMALAARGQGAPAAPDAVESSRHSGGEVLVRARLGSPGWLFISDAMYPGWRVFADGIEERIYRADLVFRAVFLTEGRHEVRFIYQPAGFRIGLWFCLASLIAAGALIIVGRGRAGRAETRKETA
ncbi:MAG TPA: hypothetical protein VM658_14655 [bacterium]|nr:hypothetical protein [bacterium]